MMVLPYESSKGISILVTGVRYLISNGITGVYRGREIKNGKWETRNLDITLEELYGECNDSWETSKNLIIKHKGKRGLSIPLSEIENIKVQLKLKYSKALLKLDENIYFSSEYIYNKSKEELKEVTKEDMETLGIMWLSYTYKIDIAEAVTRYTTLKRFHDEADMMVNNCRIGSIIKR